METTTILWCALGVYGVAMFLASPTVSKFGEFFEGARSDGREVGLWVLIASVVISWLFAKSITNSANLGASYGLVGAVAYAGWYLSIPVAGVFIYLIRKKYQSKGLSDFLIMRYGKGAALAFMLVVVLRLVNEVWSNTAVVGSYFGESG
ncbi:MAG: hypothetical protein KC561_17710, partial [Myxococcales bacterium]|nr:hypothetical protein [Myxococcales bacterium]